ncbi:hypothetical protein Purlil1_3301 [Purpureocillium lilacinum]|uniref:Uncharacterized protein n=1 Tax=Purpureocillium lilacinum TaxID=33203 RepID=A0ABR0C8Y2_PURLI|nr:hypothetical protein Purlil1_3301 [Purpureocillium lilacinum]
MKPPLTIPLCPNASRQAIRPFARPLSPWPGTPRAAPQSTAPPNPTNTAPPHIISRPAPTSTLTMHHGSRLGKRARPAPPYYPRARPADGTQSPQPPPPPLPHPHAHSPKETPAGSPAPSYGATQVVRPPSVPLKVAPSRRLGLVPSASSATPRDRKEFSPSPPGC